MTPYYVLGRILRPGAKLGFYVYNHLVKQARVRVIVRNELGEILLLKSWIGSSKWSLPGGGVEKGEDSKAAARRELLEETGITVPLERLIYITTVTHSGYSQPIFEAMVTKKQLPDKRHNQLEITHIGWFHPKKLPDVSSTVVNAIHCSDRVVAQR